MPSLSQNDNSYHLVYFHLHLVNPCRDCFLLCLHICSPNTRITKSLINWIIYVLTCGSTPSIFSDGGTLKPFGKVTWPKSTVKASHQTPKWPMSNIVRSPGNVSTMVLWSYRRKGTSFPFSSATLIPCGVGFSPAPTQNLASKSITVMHWVFIRIMLIYEFFTE